jgi:EpsI family protein
LFILNVTLLLAVLGGFWSRSLDANPLRGGDFLRTLPLAFHDWKMTEVSLEKDVWDSLSPDSVLIRRYESGRQKIELAVIAGHRRQTLHAPDYCLTSSGLEMIREVDCQLPLDSGAVQAKRMFMTSDTKEGKQGQALFTYFFTDGDYSTPSLPRFQAAQLMKRFRRVVPLGALVRVTAPFTTDPGAAIRLTDEFSRATLPAILRRLHDERIAK